MPEYKLSYTASQIDEKLGKISNLATVATSGSYNDLSDKPSHSADMITSGTFSTTEIKAKTGTDYSVARIRNIQASTTDLTAGSSALANGDIYLVYE